MTNNATQNSSDRDIDSEIDHVKAPNTATPQMRRRRTQQLSNEIGRLAGSLFGCMVIGWSCYNLVANIQTLRAAEPTIANLAISAGLLLFLLAIPFSFGLWLILRAPR